MSLYIDFTFSHLYYGERRRDTMDLPSHYTWDDAVAYLEKIGYEKIHAIRREWQAYAWPGGYPLFYYTKDGGVLSPRAANSELARTLDPNDECFFIVACEINYEDPDLWCDHTNERIPSAYCEDTK